MKRNYLKSMCAVLLASAMVLTVPVTASAETEDKIQLPAPTDLGWDVNYNATFTAVADGNEYYNVSIWRDGEYLENQYVFKMGRTDITGYISHSINESGEYYYSVRARASYGSEYTDSDWAESAKITYVKPDSVLGTTVGYWSSEHAGTFCWETVENAGGYELEVYFTPKGSAEEQNKGITRYYASVGDHHQAGQTRSHNMNDHYIQQYGAGSYRVRIRALSGDLDNYANGEFGEYSEYYVTMATSEEVSDSIKNAVASANSSSDALGQIKNTLTKEEMQIAMQTDDTVLGQMKELESKYVAEKSITVETPSVSEEAASYVSADKISMVGAGLNVDTGNVGLEVSVPDKQETVNTADYKNVVQLAIELKADNSSIHELAVPITITMPIPTGLNGKNLVILHYRADGTYETVTLKNNGDGTVTFTVTSFSTFVFAEKVENTSNNGGGNTSNNAGGNTTVDVSEADNGNDRIDVDWSAETFKLETALASGVAQNVSVTTGEAVQAPKAVLQKLAGKNVTLALQTAKGIAVSVTGTNNPVINSGVNLVVTQTDLVPDSVKGSVTAGALKTRSIHIEEKEALQLNVNIHTALGAEYEGKYANLYRYDAADKSLKLAGIYQINKDGQAMFALRQGGDYVLAVTDTAAAGVMATGGYTVVSGDTLYAIALRHGMTLKRLVEVNPQLMDVNRIYPGQIINIK